METNEARARERDRDREREFPSTYFYVHFRVEKIDGNGTIKKKKFGQKCKFKRVFSFFEEVSGLNGRWKHLCRIRCSGKQRSKCCTIHELSTCLKLKNGDMYCSRFVDLTCYAYLAYS